MIHHDLKMPEKFSGAHYDHERHYASLKGQLRAVYDVLAPGRRMTLDEVIDAVKLKMGRENLSAKSVSANIRNLRKTECGGFRVEGGFSDKTGLFEYWMVTEEQGRLF